MKRVISSEFFNRNTTDVARELIGKFLVRRVGNKEIALMITETEAYDGFHDRASHASRGMTQRNSVMFGPSGVWYVYLVYGMHEMLNIVTREKGYPAAVLLRGVRGYDGPGRLTKALCIDRSMNNKPASRKSGLWIEDRGVVILQSHIRRTPRVGIDYAGDYWRRKKWRFVLQGRARLS